MDEVDMIEHVFDLDDTSVREIMRPRPDVTSIPAKTELTALRSGVIETEYTRYPVVDESEQVIGFIDVKPILRISESTDETESITAGDLVIVPVTLCVGEALDEFQSERRQMAVVIDEWDVQRAGDDRRRRRGDRRHSLISSI